MKNRPFHLTDHAIARALDMGVDGDEIARAVLNPQDIHNGKNGAEIRVAGRVAVVFNPAVSLVVTVMWHYASTRRTDVRRGMNYGRDAVSEKNTTIRRSKRTRKQREPKTIRGRSNRHSPAADRARHLRNTKEDW